MHSPFTRWAWQCFTKCYNSKLDSGCNLDKDLSKDEEEDQLVKHKDTGLYLQLYIVTIRKKKDVLERNNEKSIRKIWEDLYYYMRH